MIALLAALPAFLASLPYLLQVMLKLMNLVEAFVGWAQEKELHVWLSDVEGHIDLLRKAKTPDEKDKAASGIADLIRKLG